MVAPMQPHPVATTSGSLPGPLQERLLQARRSECDLKDVEVKLLELAAIVQKTVLDATVVRILDPTHPGSNAPWRILDQADVEAIPATVLELGTAIENQLEACSKMESEANQREEFAGGLIYELEQLQRENAKLKEELAQLRLLAPRSRSRSRAAAAISRR